MHMRWQVYEFVKKRKGHVTISEIMREFEDIPPKEVAEGIAEYCEAYHRFFEFEGA